VNNYLSLVLFPNIKDFMIIFGIIGIIISLIIFYCWEQSCCEEEKEAFWKKGNKFLLSSIFILFITCFIPTQIDILQLEERSSSCE